MGVYIAKGKSLEARKAKAIYYFESARWHCRHQGEGEIREVALPSALDPGLEDYRYLLLDIEKEKESECEVVFFDARKGSLFPSVLRLFHDFAIDKDISLGLLIGEKDDFVATNLALIEKLGIAVAWKRPSLGKTAQRKVMPASARPIKMGEANSPRDFLFFVTAEACLPKRTLASRRGRLPKRKACPGLYARMRAKV